MLFQCDLMRVLDYNGSLKDIWINYATLLVTFIALVMCTRGLAESASKFRRAAAWFWVPFTVVLVALQIWADCSTNNVGISAVWSAFVGFICFSRFRVSNHHHRHPHQVTAGDNRPNVGSSTNPSSSLMTIATVVSVIVWGAVCVYYAVVEEVMTTVAHMVAFVVGAGTLLVFEALHRVHVHEYIDFRNGRERGTTTLLTAPQDQLQDD